VPYGPLWENITSSTKPDVAYISMPSEQYSHGHTAYSLQATSTEDSVMSEYVVCEIWSQTGTVADQQTLITKFC